MGWMRSKASDRYRYLFVCIGSQPYLMSAPLPELKYNNPAICTARATKKQPQTEMPSARKDSQDEEPSIALHADSTSLGGLSHATCERVLFWVAIICIVWPVLVSALICSLWGKAWMEQTVQTWVVNPTQALLGDAPKTDVITHLPLHMSHTGIALRPVFNTDVVEHKDFAVCVAAIPDHPLSYRYSENEEIEVSDLDLENDHAQRKPSLQLATQSSTDVTNATSPIAILLDQEDHHFEPALVLLKIATTLGLVYSFLYFFLADCILNPFALTNLWKRMRKMAHTNPLNGYCSLEESDREYDDFIFCLEDKASDLPDSSSSHSQIEGSTTPELGAMIDTLKMELDAAIAERDSEHDLNVTLRQQMKQLEVNNGLLAQNMKRWQERCAAEETSHSSVQHAAHVSRYVQELVDELRTYQLSLNSNALGLCDEKLNFQTNAYALTATCMTKCQEIMSLLSFGEPSQQEEILRPPTPPTLSSESSTLNHQSAPIGMSRDLISMASPSPGAIQETARPLKRWTRIFGRKRESFSSRLEVSPDVDDVSILSATSAISKCSVLSRVKSLLKPKNVTVASSHVTTEITP